MKLGTKLLLSYLAVALLVLLVGAGSFILNENIKEQLIRDSHESVSQIQRLSRLEFDLQNSLLFTRNFLTEKSRERERERERGASDVQLKSRAAETAAKRSPDRFAQNLDSIQAELAGPGMLRGEQDQIDMQMKSFADTMAVSFELYSSLIEELFDSEDEIMLGDEIFNLTIEPYFRTTLLGILDDFRSIQSNRISMQMDQIREQTERTTVIIFVITCIAFIVACALAYLIYRSIARPIRHLMTAAEEIGSGNLDKRIQIGTKDELEQLGNAFNQMASNLNRSMVSRRYVNNIIQSMGDMLVVTDTRYRVELINKSTAETLEYSTDGLNGEEIWTLFDTASIEELRASLSASHLGRGFETAYRTRGGKVIPVIMSFSSLKDLTGELVGYVFVASNITAQKEAEEKLNKSLREKEVLLAEIHHRVKNNLAVICGLLEMQVWNLPDDDKSISPLKESQLRIQSIALVHELLYQSENFSEVKYDEYILKLLKAIQQMHRGQKNSIRILNRLQPVRLTIQKAIPASLILNELIVNAYKHAFNDQTEGEINITLSQTESSGVIELTVQDNGIGLPPDFDPMHEKSLGMTLLKTLIQQIRAELDVCTPPDGGSGSKFVIRFPGD